MAYSFIKKSGKYYGFALIILLSFISTQCASSNMAKGPDNDYSMDLGDSEASGVEKLINRLTDRHHFELERNETYGSGERFVRTYWRTFPPFSTNPNYKAKGVKVRIILRTRQKNSQGYKLYRIKFTGEYEAELPNESGSYEYQKAPLTPEARDYLKDIANDLKDAVRGSIRGY